MLNNNTLSRMEEENTPSYLPPEVWELILLKKVTSPQDQFTCAQVCLAWKEILRPTQPIWLFHQLLPIIFNDRLSYDDILNCRLVCHGWKQSVDSFFQNKSLDQRLDYFPPNPSFRNEPSPQWQKAYTLPHQLRVQRFLNFTGGFSISRHIHLVCHPRCGHHFWEKVIQLLDKLGHHIWDLKVTYNKYDSHTNFMFHLQMCFRRLPNLRKLSLSMTEMPLNFETKNKAEMMALFKERPFPIMSSLKTLILSDQIPAIFHEWMFEGYSPQLEVLVMCDLFRTETKSVFKLAKKHIRQFSSSTCFPNLTDLHILVGSKKDVINLLDLTCPLKILRIHVDYPKYEITDILKVLNHFGATVEVVHLEFSCFTDDIKETKRWLKTSPQNYHLASSPTLSRIQTLYLHNPSVILDCLPWFDGAGLTKLQISWGWDLDSLFLSPIEGAQERILVYGWVDRMYQSNIWDRMSNLNEIKLGVYDGYIESVFTGRYKYFRRVYNKLKRSDRSGEMETGGIAMKENKKQAGACVVS